jgi:sarcosine oxidase, subunit gamma
VTAEARARSPLAHRSADLAAIAARDGSTLVAEVPFLTQIGLRVDAASAEDLAVPRYPNTVRAEGDRSTLWLGPDDWLITAPPDSAAAIIEELEAGLADHHHTCVDLSANRAVLDLRGAGAREILERGCSLDLHPSRWAVGMCAQTNLARTQVILEQRPDATRIFVRPSFADYLLDWLAVAAGDR